MRRIITARDPLAVMDAFTVETRVKLAGAFGVRMCPICPRCNETEFPCQDKFGSNMMPLGGVVGAVPAIGGAGEHQGVGTPHLHGNVHVSCVYQFCTLKEIADRMLQAMLDAESVKKFQAWLHKEDPMVQAQHNTFEPKVEQAWQQRFADREHDAMCTTPAYMTEGERPTMWGEGGPSREEALEDGKQFKHAYFADAQFIFSRVQHHIHKKTKRGYVPLKACLSKRCKKGHCKAGFPKDKLQSKTMLVVCRGVAKIFGLRLSGRRNSLGSVLGRRTGPWQSGTHQLLQLFFGATATQVQIIACHC